MKNLLFMLLLLGSCDEVPTKDPFILEKGILANTVAFKEASKHIMANFEKYYGDKSRLIKVQNFLAIKSLTIGGYNFHISVDNDTIITYQNNDYVYRNDTVYRHYILYDKTPLPEIFHTKYSNALRTRIDTDLYYIVFCEYSP